MKDKLPKATDIFWNGECSPILKMVGKNISNDTEIANETTTN